MNFVREDKEIWKLRTKHNSIGHLFDSMEELQKFIEENNIEKTDIKFITVEQSYKVY